MPKQKDIPFASIEFGTHSIKVLIGEFSANDELTIIGRAETESLKVVKGEISNLGMVSEQLAQAIDQAQQMAGVDIQDAFITLIVSGAYISQSIVSADIAITSADKLVSQDDIDNAIRNARLKDASAKMDILNTSNRFYTLSDGRQVLDPIGLASHSLQTSLLLIQARKDRLRTPINLIRQCIGRDPNDITYVPMALGKACLSPEEVERNGQILIDLGAGVTSYALFTSAGCHTAGQFTVGFEQAANDLSIAFGLPIQYARNLLQSFESLKLSAISANDGRSRLIDVERGPGTLPRRIAASSVEQVIQLRFTELFQIIKERLQRDNAWQWATGTVRLSGGLASLPGMTALAHDILEHEVEIAAPLNVRGPSAVLSRPAFIEPIGALRCAKTALDIYNNQTEDASSKSSSATSNILGALRNFLNI